MSKKRRTKKEKITASVRHDFSSVLITPRISNDSGERGEQKQSFEIKLSNIAPSQKSQNTSPVTSYSRSHAYVLGDIRKTVNITAVLLALNVAIYFLLKLKFVNIPGIGF
ncbi:MAG TPA: hypothetical protein VG965_04870 [Patescibacteria group bacterium]|nr:hypothetical protein [Patescibacteria group bacterium]